MTIKEIEALTGMTRANIRFYESQGLLSPERGENGYRDYKEDDLSVLQRIKLLRMLELSLDEIQKLQTGEESMDAVLSRHLEQLEQQGERIAQCREICAQMKADKVQYRTLNANKYLQKVNQSKPEGQPEPQWKMDVLPQVRAPFRRFFARGLDLGMYTALWQLFLIFVLDWNLQNRLAGMELVDTVAGLVVELLGKIPKTGERPSVTLKNLTFTVEEVEDRRVSKILIVKGMNQEDESEESSRETEE